MNIILEEYKNEKKNVYKALDEGIYDAKIKDVELTTSKKGNKMMVLTIELQGEKMLNGAHLGGRMEKYYILLGDKYAGVKMHSLLKGVGVDVKVGDNINIEQLVVSNVIQGKNVRVKLNKDTYINNKGETKECNRIMYLLQSEQSSVEEMDVDDIPF